MHTEILEASSEESDSPESDTHYKTHFENNDGLIKKELTTDGIHLNSKGYQVWIEIVRPLISNLK